jgi:flagellin-like hook-associated protein FlgL
MASGTILSAGVRQNLLALQNTADLISVAQNRLATGKRVNSALDNPSNFFTSQALNSRAADLSNLLDGISNGIKTLEAADKGLTAITKLIESAQSTARQARQDASPATTATITSTALDGATSQAQAAAKLLEGTAGSTGLGLDGTGADSDTIRITSVNSQTGGTVQVDVAVTATKTVQDLVNEVNASGAAIASITSDGKLKLEATSDNASLKVEVDTDASNAFANDRAGVAKLLGSGTDNDIRAASAAADDPDLIVTGLGGAVDVTGASTLDKLGLDDDDSLTLRVTDTSGNVSTQTYSVAAAGTETINDLVAALTGTGGIGVAVDAANDELELTGTSTTQKIELAFDDDASDSTTSANFGGLLEAASLVSARDGGGAGASAVRKQLASQFNELRTQIDKLATDSGFNGINLLGGDKLRVVFNEKTGDNQNFLDINGVAYSSLALGIKDAASASSGYNNFASNADVDTALGNLSDALSSIRAQSSVFGSNLSVVQTRQDFTKNIAATLRAGADNLVLADQNEEAANLLALQTRQQLASTALSLANQADQSVLRLF